MEYIAYLHKDADSDYGVSFPDFPGCVTAGSTLEEARRMAAEALAFHISGMRQDSEKIPAPSTLDDLNNDPARKGAVAFLVRPEAEERTIRINITLPERQLVEIDKRAKAANLSRSSFLVKSALGKKPVKSESRRSVRRRFRKTA